MNDETYINLYKGQVHRSPDDSVVIIAKAGEVFRAYGPKGDRRGIYVMSKEEGGCNDFLIVPPLDYAIEG